MWAYATVIDNSSGDPSALRLEVVEKGRSGLLKRKIAAELLVVQASRLHIG